MSTSSTTLQLQFQIKNALKILYISIYCNNEPELCINLNINLLRALTTMVDRIILTMTLTSIMKP